MLHKEGQNAITNKRLYLVSWSADIRTSRRRGWCSYIELLSTCHFGLPGGWPLYVSGGSWVPDTIDIVYILSRAGCDTSTNNKVRIESHFAFDACMPILSKRCGTRHMLSECRSHLFPCHAIHAKLRQAAASQELRGLHFSHSSAPTAQCRVEVGPQQ